MAFYVLDTSVLISTEAIAPGMTSAISVVSLAELHFGVLRARSTEQRAERVRRLGVIESRYSNPLPVDDVVAREWAALMATVAERGGQAPNRTTDLLIAATARVHGATLLTHNIKDFSLVEDLVAVRRP